MLYHKETEPKSLRAMFKSGEITLGGNKTLKIYGSLHCRSGKRMKKENRVFFGSETEAVAGGFRPCGHCMKDKYEHWKNNL